MSFNLEIGMPSSNPAEDISKRPERGEWLLADTAQNTITVQTILS